MGESLDSEFDINIHTGRYTGVEGQHNDALFYIGNQMRLRNYIELLKMRDRKNVIKEVLRLIKELQEE